MKNKPTYAGTIKNQGSQVVKAPFGNANQGKTAVKKGKDLRTAK